MSLTAAEIKRRADCDEAYRVRQAWQRALDAACRAGERAAGTIPPPIPLSSDYQHQIDGDYESLYSPNPAMDLEEVEREYLALCADETGDTIEDEKQLEIARRRDELEAQSHTIAERLQSVAVSAYRETPFSLYHYAIHSRRIVKVPNFRRICLLPYIANSLRGPVVSALEYFLDKHPFCRFWTFTTGLRCPLSDLRQRVKALHRKLSKLNDEPFMRAAGLRIVFRSTEFGTPETNTLAEKVLAGEIERDDSGKVLFHPHAHCVVFPARGHISARKWAGILKQVWKFWGDQWDDGGSIGTARECCKYVTKPAAMLALTAAELGELYRQTYRLKLIQPMAQLANEIADRAEKRQRLVRRPAPNGEGRIYQIVRDWNKQPRRTKVEKDIEAALKLDQRERGECLRVMSRSVPSFCGAGMKEPRVTIMCCLWNEQAVREHPLVARLIRETEDAWQAGLYIRVHTCTPTVREAPPPDSCSQRLFPELAAK